MNDILNKAMALAKAINESGEAPDDKKMDIKNMERYLKSFPEYLNSVINYSIKGHMVGILFEEDEYRERMSELDSDRRRKHINATDNINKLNRLARYYHIGDIIPTDRGVLNAESVNDREYAIRLVYNFCTSVFLDEVERSGYNIRGMQDQDLMNMVESHGSFHTNLRLEEEDYER